VVCFLASSLPLRSNEDESGLICSCVKIALYSQHTWRERGGEKVNMIESLAEEEKATIYKMLDAFLGKKKLKDALVSVLKDME